jgi:hypothetical protein
VGERLVPANEDNELGFYEDVEFMELNRELIAAGLSAEPDLRPRWMYADRIDAALLAPFAGRASEMIETRAADGCAWGFKDPRTAALLDFWDAAAPGARYVFVYRPPWDVVDSMFRLSRRPLGGRADLAVAAWVHYNRAIVDFAGRNPDRCALVHSEALVARPRAVVERANELLRAAGSPELGEPASDAVDRDLLRALPETSALAEVLRSGFPDAAAVYAQLERVAALSHAALEPVPAGGGDRPVPAVRADAGGLPVGLVVVAADAPAPGAAREEVTLPPLPSPGTAANAGVAATSLDLVAVAFGAAPDVGALARAVETAQARVGRAVVLGTGARAADPEVLHPRELLREAFEPWAVVLRRSMWQAIGGFDETVPAGGLDGWSAAVQLAANGVPLMALEVPAGGDPHAQPPPAARDRAWRHVAERHSELFARHFAEVHEQLVRRVTDLEGQRDRALGVRDELEATARDTQVRVEDAEARAERGATLAREAWARADEAEGRLAAVEAERDEAGRRLAAVEAERDQALERLTGLTTTRSHRLARAWWRAKGRVRPSASRD